MIAMSESTIVKADRFVYRNVFKRRRAIVWLSAYL